MTSITVIQKDGSLRLIETQEGWSLMEILRDAGIAEIEGVCGGSMACATCHVVIHPDWAQRVSSAGNEKTGEEEDMLDLAHQVRETSRLGCQVRMSNTLNGLIVAVPGAKTKW